MIFYLTIGICWALFCLWQSVMQFHHVAIILEGPKIYIWYVLGSLINAVFWPITLGVGIYKYIKGTIKVVWEPKSEAAQFREVVYVAMKKELE